MERDEPVHIKMQLQLIMAPSDLIAALQAYVQNPANFTPPVQHQLDGTVQPQILANGSVTLNLNF
jgi:hypothetical protein